jgi:hypothetical protein
LSLERRILRFRRRSGYGAERLKMEFDLPCGLSSIRRILVEHDQIKSHRSVSIPALLKGRVNAGG